MRNYVKSTKHILAIFDQECRELCYTDYIPLQVEEAREKLRKTMDKGPSKMEIVKEQVMHTLRNTFDPDSYDLTLASFAEDGERRI